jgi:glycosyltransferase involved in cell wall biosynthesis/SAM-dependent methyltransferase
MVDQNKIKIVHVIDNLRIGGAEKQLALFCRSIDRARFVQVVLCMRESGPLEQELLEMGAEILILGKKKKIDPFFFYRLVRGLSKLDPDIVHCWLFSANLWGRLACLFLPRIRVIATERVEGDWKRWYHRVIDRLLLALRTDILLANSRGVIAYCYERECLRLDKVRLVFNAIDVKERVRVSHENATRQRIIVTMSRLTDQKGIDCFIRTAKNVLKEYPNAEFRIYGEGEKKADYQRLAQQEGIQNKVCFKEKERVDTILYDADLYLSASRFEGLPNAIMEAMAHGVPVVATNIGGTNELIAHGQTGLLAEKNDDKELAVCVLKVLRDIRYGEELGAAGREHINKNFLITDVVKDLEHVYEELMGKRGKSASVVLLANKVIQKQEAEMFELIHPELFKGREVALLSQDIKRIKDIVQKPLALACDVGAGTGRVTRAFLREGFKVVAVELSEEMLAVMTRHAGHEAHLSIVREDIHTFLLKNKEPFDIISFSAVLHHFIDYQNVLGQAAACLRPGGVLFISHEPVLRRRLKKARLAYCIDKIDSLIFRAWLYVIKGKRLPVTDYTQSDPFGVEGIDEAVIKTALEKKNFTIVKFERYAPRKTKMMSLLDQCIFKTGHQFSLIAVKTRI